MPPQEISSRIREVREKIFGRRGGLAAFMRATGIDAALLGRYENGVEPTASKLATIIQATRCSAAWLLTGEGEMFDGPAEPLHIPTYRTGGGLHWVVSEDLEPYDTTIPSGLVAYQVSGDSMEPLARDGQIVLALRGVQPRYGDLAVVEMNDGTHTFKRYCPEGDQVMLVSVNPGHQPELVRGRDIRSAMKVWGVKF